MFRVFWGGGHGAEWIGAVLAGWRSARRYDTAKVGTHRDADGGRRAVVEPYGVHGVISRWVRTTSTSSVVYDELREVGAGVVVSLSLLISVLRSLLCVVSRGVCY